MYDLPYHKEKNEQVIKEFIVQYPFAFLAGSDLENKPVATQLPLLIKEKDRKKFLRGHIMKNTDHHKAFLQNNNVLAVFTGHHAYVSGTWYDNPYQPSTWNYMSVHAKGIIRFLDEVALVEVLRMTTLHFEDYNPQSETIFDNLPRPTPKKLMKAIVAFEIEIQEVDTVFKLSQDRDAKSYENILACLRIRGEAGQAIAAEMEKRTREVFKDDVVLD
ncbi:MAG: FMN-binding negative transcriptional regulator [Bacteroidales bacterium]|nr:FMN-binding negative transcriptional regulator [Bacteroidales bacterium]